MSTSLKKEIGSRAVYATQIDEETLNKGDRWSLDNKERCANYVILFCLRNNIPCVDVTPAQLIAASQEMPYWQQGASHWLDMVYALQAAANVRCGNK
jgi:hypothetical protein